MKNLLALAVLALGLHGALAADNDPVSAKTNSEPIVLSTADMNKIVDSANWIVTSGEGLCSGTLISIIHRLILTAHHCIDSLITTVEKEVKEDGEVKKKNVEVFQDAIVKQKVYDGAREVGGSQFQAAILAYDKEHDLGLLQIRADKIPQTLAVKVYNDEDGAVQRGVAVWAMGNPLGLDASVSFGHIASTNRLWKLDNGDEVAYYQTDAGMLTFGNSGGALMMGPYLIGVPDKTAPGTPVSLEIPYKFVQALLSKNCFEEVWNDHAAQSYAVCDAEKKAKADDKTTVKDLLRKLVDKSK